MGAMGDGGSFAGVDGRPTKLQLLTVERIDWLSRIRASQCAHHPDLPALRADIKHRRNAPEHCGLLDFALILRRNSKTKVSSFGNLFGNFC